MSSVAENPLFIKWIVASVFDYFNTFAETVSIPLYFDGTEPDFSNQQKLVEVRISGIRVTKKLEDNFFVELDLHLMCSCKLGNNDYDLHELVGQFNTAANGPISVYQQDGTDSPPYIECFILKNDTDPIEIIPWGLVQVNTGPLRVNQTSIESHYLMTL